MANKPVVLYKRVLDDLSNEIEGVTCPSFEPSTAREYALHALSMKYLDKFVETNARARRAAEREFFRCNLKCSSHVVTCGPTDHLWFDQALHEAREILRSFFVDFEYDGDNFWALFRPGPGVSCDTKETGYAQKMFHSRLGFPTEIALRQFVLTSQTRPYGGYIYRNSTVVHVSPVEKLQFVPKNSRTDRPIGIQPLGAVCGQLALGRLIQQRLTERFGLDIERQADVQRAMVCTMRFASIDLKSASSLLSYRLVKELLPSHIFQQLEAWRSRRIQYKGRDLPMYTFASMGNGYIFPLQTLVFYALCAGVYKVLDLPVRRCGTRDSTLGVFGDDILCKPEAFDLICRFLSMLGLEVNATKSFKDGSFRESCGVDVFKGEDVRPPFLKSLDTIQDTFVAFNTLAMFYARWKIKRTTALELLLRWTNPSKNLWLVPMGSPLDSGILTSRDVLDLVVGLDKPCWVGRRANGSYLYKCFVARARNERLDDYIARETDAYVLDLVLSGTARDGVLSKGRPDRVRYRTTWSYCVNWDYRNQLDRPVVEGFGKPYSRYSGYDHGDSLKSVFVSLLQQ